jgi:hypothetical protein
MSVRCRIITLELPECEMKGQDTERFAGVLPQCPALAHLDLSGNPGFGAAGAMPGAGAPQSPQQSDRTSRGREPCRSAGAVHSAGSPQSRWQLHRHCRAREPSRFFAWSSLWPSFVDTSHCLHFAICLVDRQHERATYYAHNSVIAFGLALSL